MKTRCSCLWGGSDMKVEPIKPRVSPGFTPPEAMLDGLGTGCQIAAASDRITAHSARSFCPSERVVECGLLSGLSLRHFARPLAGMVICGSDPNLMCELQRSQVFPGFPDPDRFDHCAHSGHRLLIPLSPEASYSAQHRSCRCCQ
jgi:hypothetical protein